MKQFLFALLALVVITSSCSDRDDDLTAVNIRLRNTSEVNFDEVIVGDESQVYENIAPDSFSDYREFETAYRYAYVQITSGEETFVLQPIDFVGEEALPIGIYTYELSLTEEGQVTLEFRID
jgi:hypothetical protein